jgi:DNA-binding transcriptional LysR family regulator
MSMTLQLIEQAIVLGDTGNFARAAERLGITQPALSRNIAAQKKQNHRESVFMLALRRD